MTAGNDFAVVGALQRLVAVERLDRLLQIGNQLFFHAPMHEQIVRCNAGLPCIREFPEGDALCGQLQPSIVMDDARALAAEL
ncbi:hypothetical protein D3C85_1788070 [compost metagenome]